VKNVKSKGYDAKIIGKRNGMNVVSAGHANTSAEAQVILKQARKDVLKEAWILNIKK
jgi:hypothetical protein